MWDGKVTKRETFTTTLNFGEGRRIDINRTMLIAYAHEGAFHPDDVKLLNDPLLTFEGFTPAQEQEFRAIFEARGEAGFMEAFEKFVERMRVYRPVVIGEGL